MSYLPIMAGKQHIWSKYLERVANTGWTGGMGTLFSFIRSEDGSSPLLDLSIRWLGQRLEGELWEPLLATSHQNDQGDERWLLPETSDIRGCPWLSWKLVSLSCPWYLGYKRDSKALLLSKPGSGSGAIVLGTGSGKKIRADTDSSYGFAQINAAAETARKKSKLAKEQQWYV
jgi:hypothetical protein